MPDVSHHQDASDSLNSNNRSPKHRTFSSHHFFIVLASVLCIVSCAGVSYLFWNEQKNTIRMQAILDAQQSQLTQLQSSMETSQSNLQKTLSQWNLKPEQTQKQLVIASVAYLVNMANLALMIHQDSKAASQFLDAAQTQLLNFPSMESLRTNILTQKNALDTTPNVDVDTLLSQINMLKNQVTNITDNPHFYKPEITESTITKPQDNTLSQQSIADWKTLLSWLKRFVIISHPDNDPTSLPTQNHLQSVKDYVLIELSTAQWAILHSNANVYANAINQAITVLTTIEKSDPAFIKSTQSQLITLSSIDVNAHYPSLDDLIKQISSFQNSQSSADSDSIDTHDSSSHPSASDNNSKTNPTRSILNSQATATEKNEVFI
jgi:uncharacterized protein HemX